MRSKQIQISLQKCSNVELKLTFEYFSILTWEITSHVTLMDIHEN